MKSLNIILIALLMMSLQPALGEGESKAPERELSGNWKVIMSNSLTRRQVTFVIDHKNGRLRGKVLEKGAPDFELDGRTEKNDRVILWGRYVDRTGMSMDYQFKGKLEGEPGSETINGKCEYFGKRYDFTASRSDG